MQLNVEEEEEQVCGGDVGNREHVWGPEKAWYNHKHDTGEVNLDSNEWELRLEEVSLGK